MRTVKIRTLVAVDQQGRWDCQGGSHVSEFEAKDYIAQGPLQDYVFHWVEAEVPVPERQTFQGEVVP